MHHSKTKTGSLPQHSHAWQGPYVLADENYAFTFGAMSCLAFRASRFDGRCLITGRLKLSPPLSIFRSVLAALTIAFHVPYMRF